MSNPSSQPQRRSVVTRGVGPTEVGELPTLGTVPTHMHAQVIRPGRYGDPATAFQAEVVETPHIGPDEVLIAVRASTTTTCGRPAGIPSTR